jgi:hypothetical protein
MTLDGSAMKVSTATVTMDVGATGSVVALEVDRAA